MIDKGLKSDYLVESSPFNSKRMSYSVSKIRLFYLILRINHVILYISFKPTIDLKY